MTLVDFLVQMLLVLAGSVPDVPFVEGDRNPARETGCETRQIDRLIEHTNALLHIHGARDRGVVIVGSVVAVDRDVIHVLSGFLEDRHVPVHFTAVRTDGSELDIGRDTAHELGVLANRTGVILGGEASDLVYVFRLVYLVADTPVPYAERPFVAELFPHLRVFGIAGAVTILHPRGGFLGSTASDIDAQVRFGAEHAAVCDELVGSESVRLIGIVPREIHARRPLIDRSYPVTPVIAVRETAAGPTDD